MLALCNFPKAVEAITKVTSNHLESSIYPSKTQRGISLPNLALFMIDFRLVREYIVWFLNLVDGLLNVGFRFGLQRSNLQRYNGEI